MAKKKEDSLLKLKDPDKKLLKEYSDIAAEQEVIGCIYKNPALLGAGKDNLTSDDFVGSINKIIYTTIHDMLCDGIKKIDIDAIEKYLDSFPIQKNLFEKGLGRQYLTNAEYVCDLDNFNANYELVKKYSMLRELVKMGINVGEFYDPFALESAKIEAMQKIIRKATVNEIVDHYKNKLTQIGNDYLLNREDKSIHAGDDDFMELIEKWKKKPDYGAGFSCDLLTTFTHGMKRKKLMICSAPSGYGKTRIALSTIAHTFASQYYDPKTNEWKATQTGGKVGCLYIGTEMEVESEIVPLLVSYIACVPSNTMTEGRCTEDELERIAKAHRILKEESAIYLMYIPDYNLAKLESAISYHVEMRKVEAVFFDYIHSTAELDAEYIKTSMMPNPREDQVLANVSLKLKNLAQQHNIFVYTATQTSGDMETIKRNRDSSCVRGSKALVDKADVCFIVTPIAEGDTEWKKLSNIQSHCINFKETKGPNLCITIHKNRSGENNRLLWIKFDYATLRMHDLFVTDREYNVIGVTQIRVKGIDENGQVIYVKDEEVFDDREALEKEIIQKREQEEYLAKQKEVEILAKLGAPGSLFETLQQEAIEEDEEFCYTEHSSKRNNEEHEERIITQEEDEYGDIVF